MILSYTFVNIVTHTYHVVMQRSLVVYREISNESHVFSRYVICDLSLLNRKHGKLFSGIVESFDLVRVCMTLYVCA